ncbi:MAG: glycosyltransferase [Petrotogales bacterium]
MDSLNDIDVRDVGLVILNYMTSHETGAMINSVKNYYPQLRIVVVDNGSSTDAKKQLRDIVTQHRNVSTVYLQENRGFAGGNNAGIYKLRKLGYEYVICSNNDVLFKQPRIIETLKYYCIQTDAALAGPRILNLNNQDQNPYKLRRPSLKDAKSYYRRACWIPDIAYPVLKLWRFVKHSIRNKSEKNLQYPPPEKPCQVYALHGSFIMFSPLFFKFYNGFDSNTFLYCEENVLGEMLFAKGLKAVFVPGTKVIHKEDKTINFVWGDDLGRQMFKHKKRSVRYWFKCHYLNR